MKQTKHKIKMTLLGSKTVEIKFSDANEAKEVYDLLKNTMLFMNQAIKQIELL